jgi:hypothetical protein
MCQASTEFLAATAGVPPCRREASPTWPLGSKTTISSEDNSTTVGAVPPRGRPPSYVTEHRPRLDIPRHRAAKPTKHHATTTWGRGCCRHHHWGLTRRDPRQWQGRGRRTGRGVKWRCCLVMAEEGEEDVKGSLVGVLLGRLQNSNL